LNFKLWSSPLESPRDISQVIRLLT